MKRRPSARCIDNEHRPRGKNTDELVTTPREAPPFKPYKVPRDMLEVFKRIDPNKVNISPNCNGGTHVGN